MWGWNEVNLEVVADQALDGFPAGPDAEPVADLLLDDDLSFCSYFRCHVIPPRKSITEATKGYFIRGRTTVGRASLARRPSRTSPRVRAGVGRGARSRRSGGAARGRRLRGQW